MAHGPNFVISVQGIREVDYMFKGIGARANACQPVMESIYIDILEVVRENFDTEGGRTGSPWMPVTLTTQIWKARHGYDPRILHATGELREAMSTFRHPLQYSRIEAFKIVIQSKLLRGKLHQVGYSIPHHGFAGGSGFTKVDARPYLRFREDDRKRFAQKILVWITRGEIIHGGV